MMRKNLWIASGVAVVVVMAGLLVYGSYISARYQMEALQISVREQWAQLDGAIRRWAAVTPQAEAAVAPLVSAARQTQMAQQNQIAIDALRSTRQAVLQTDDPHVAIAASRRLEEALGGVMAIATSRPDLQPDLQKDAKFQSLQQRLHRMQMRVQEDGRRYNESLRNYNLFVGDFPNSIWAKIGGFGPDHNFFPKPAGNS